MMSYTRRRARRMSFEFNAASALVLAVALVSACTELKREPMTEADSSVADPARPTAEDGAAAGEPGESAAEASHESPNLGTGGAAGSSGDAPGTSDHLVGDHPAAQPGGEPPACNPSTGEDCAPTAPAAPCAAPPCADGCPEGFTEDGSPGSCLPQLTSLDLSAGTMVPELNPTVTEYQIELPFVQSGAWTLTPTVAPNVRLELNGEVAMAGVPTTIAPPLAGETLIVANLSHNRFGSRSYRLRASRTGTQRGPLATTPATGGLGASLAASEALAVVGAPRAAGMSNVGLSAEVGAAFVYEDAAGQLQQRAQLQPSQPARAGHFGQQVAIEGGRIAVAAPNDAAGAVYLFEQDGSGWTETARLVPAQSASRAGFGRSLALHGDTLIVGAPDDDERPANGAGAVYVFQRSGGTFSQSQRLVSPQPQLLGWFGSSVAFDGQTLVVGAFGESPVDTSCGAAYVFTLDNGRFTNPRQLVAEDAAIADLFGGAATVDGNTLVVGAVGASPAALAAGAAYVFTRDGTGSWTQRAQLSASNPTIGAFFGSSVALRKGALLIGATRESSAGRGIRGELAGGVIEGSGAAYLFIQGDSGFSQLAMLKAEQPQAGDYYGSGVALIGDGVLIGAEGGGNGDSSAPGALYEVR